MLSANCFNLDQSKILSSCNQLNTIAEKNVRVPDTKSPIWCTQDKCFVYFWMLLLPVP